MLVYIYSLLFPFASARVSETFRKWIVVDLQLRDLRIHEHNDRQKSINLT